MKSIISRRNNADGFAMIFLLVALPSLLPLLFVIYKLIFIIEFKSEFRFKCISESLILQKALFREHTNSLKQSRELLEKLQTIQSPIKYYVTLSDYPKYETAKASDLKRNLAYKLNYKWISDFSLVCGTTLIKREGQWHYEIIYTTNEDKY